MSFFNTLIMRIKNYFRDRRDKKYLEFHENARKQEQSWWEEATKIGAYYDKQRQED